MKKWKVFLIQHAHTDIGYTERQEKLCRYHRDYIRQALDILDDAHAGNIDAPGFKWQLENLWQLDNFYAEATPQDCARLEKYVRSGEIGLSGNYLNLNEIVDWDTLLECTSRARKYGKRLGRAIESGMSADINGYAWGYPDALSMSGVNNLFCALHSHHGMIPLGKKHVPFLWEGPRGNKVLTWVGEHYHFGNDLGFAPGGSSNYMVNDDRRTLATRGSIYTTDAATTEAEEEETLRLRLTRYLDSLEVQGYPYDFIPLMVSGCITDNAPPSAAIARRVRRINEMLPFVDVEMSTLDDFFDHVRRNVSSIPTLRGDFADWWADGADSTPNTIKVFRDAQRRMDICRRLDPDNKYGSESLMHEATQNIMMYAEHTWGYSSSVSAPWDSFVGLLEKKKDAFAVIANNAAAMNLDKILAAHGEVSIRAFRPQRFKVINPYDHAYKGSVKLSVEFWEKLDGLPFDLAAKPIVKDINSGEVYPAQSRTTARAYEIEAAVELASHEEKELMLTLDRTNESMITLTPCQGAEGVADIVRDGLLPEMPCLIESPYFRVDIESDKGITSIIDKSTGKNIVMPDSAGAFSGIYEITHAGKLGQCEVRHRMGRNRRCMATQQYTAHLTDCEIVESGDVCVTAKLSYELPGCRFYFVYLKLLKHAPVIEARICLHKTSEWDPENLYVALPFAADGSNETYIDKTGCIMRPGIDQLPDTCMQYWSIQQGLVRKGDKRDLIIACKDAPLISLGDLKYGPIELCRGDNTALNRACAYSWVMNNFWETNFKADLGGFYEFTYTLESVASTDTEREIDRCRELNQGVPSFYC